MQTVAQQAAAAAKLRHQLAETGAASNSNADLPDKQVHNSSTSMQLVSSGTQTQSDPEFLSQVEPSFP